MKTQILKDEPDTVYPLLKQHGLFKHVVLFSALDTGTLMVTGLTDGPGPVGTSNSEWRETEFVFFPGTIELTNI